MPKYHCAHCGLPVIKTENVADEKIFCCYGCYLVNRIVGEKNSQEGVWTWNLLRMCIGAFFAMNVMMLSLLLYTGEVEVHANHYFRGLIFALATPAMIILGYPFITGALADISKRKVSLDMLIALGALSAFMISAVHTVAGEGHIYFDTATMLPALVTFGKLIEATAKQRTFQSIQWMQTLLPKTAWKITSQELKEVPSDTIRVMDHIKVRAGERFAVDGTILEGITQIEESAFTGESKPRICKAGDQVWAGTVNGAGPLIIEAKRIGQDLLLSHILNMVQDACEQSSSLERIAEIMARIFTPVVVLLSIGAGMAWLMFGTVENAISVALAVVVVACPCALGIATPLATSLAIGRAAREGIIVRGGDVLERIGKIDMMFFDKTGTLTLGEPIVQSIEVLDPSTTQDELIYFLASLELGSEHTLGKAIIRLAQEKGFTFSRAEHVKAFPGLGVEGVVQINDQQKKIKAGTQAFILGSAEELSKSEDSASLIYVAWDGKTRGLIRLCDIERPEALETIQSLKQNGIEPILVTGDRFQPAKSLADKIEINRIDAPCRPEEKIQLIRQCRSSGHIPAMVGDGINDAPALAEASVGIALGAGTDLARQAGNVVLLSNRLDRIPWLIRLSRYTRKIITQNLVWAFGYNSVALAAAALGFLHPLFAAITMTISSLTVISNSMRLKNF